MDGDSARISRRRVGEPKHRAPFSSLWKTEGIRPPISRATGSCSGKPFENDSSTWYSSSIHSLPGASATKAKGPATVTPAPRTGARRRPGYLTSRSSSRHRWNRWRADSGTFSPRPWGGGDMEHWRCPHSNMRGRSTRAKLLELFLAELHTKGASDVVEEIVAGEERWQFRDVAF